MNSENTDERVVKSLTKSGTESKFFTEKEQHWRDKALANCRLDLIITRNAAHFNNRC